MKLLHALSNILKPTLWILCGAIAFALLFVGSYIYVDYQGYLSSYQAVQKKELHEAQQKIQSKAEALKKLSMLTRKRISSSKGNAQQIQLILSSSYSLLPEVESLKIQKAKYDKFSKPQAIITRFGSLPLKLEGASLDPPSVKDPSVFLNPETFFSKTWVFDREGRPDGVLEIHVDLSHLKKTVSLGSTLSFGSSPSLVLLQKSPLPIYGIPSIPFWEYGVKNFTHYVVFFLFTLLFLIIMVLSVGYLGFHLKKANQEEFESLKNALSKAYEDKNKVEQTLFLFQQGTHHQQTTYQSYKKLQLAFQNRQTEQASLILRSLYVAIESINNPKAALPFQELLEILISCVDAAEDISNGTCSRIKEEAIDVSKVLEEIRMLFAEKIYKSNLTMSITSPDNLFFQGDLLLIKLLLLNVIGKPLYMLPKNGKIEIKATEQKEGLYIQVKDNGYAFNEKSHQQMKQAFEFFLREDIFLKLCQKNNFIYHPPEIENGMNISKIYFPQFEQQLGDNVVLFNSFR